MNKFIIEESEKERILSMHKSLLKEQTEPSLKDKLQQFINDGCFPNGNPKVVPMKTSNPQKSFAIKIESTKTPGKFRYFFIDNTYGTVGADGKFKYGTEKWECNTNRIQSDKEKQAKDKAGSESQKAATDSNIENLKKEGAWKTYDELIATETKENINNPAMYEKKVVDGVTLYRRTSGRGIAGGLDKRQQDVIKQFQDKGAKLENEVSELESKAWTRKLVSPKSDGLFSEDLYMYFPPNTITNADITTAFETAVSKSDSIGLANLYTTDTKWMNPNAPAVEGRTALVSKISQDLQAGIGSAKLTTAEVWGDENYVTEEGNYKLFAKDGKEIDKGKYLILWKRVDGKLMFHRDIYNSDLPAAPAAK